MNRADHQKQRDRIAHIHSGMLDIIEKAIDTLAAEYAPRKPAPADVARRQIANIMQVSYFCANRACRRSHCCRGEPLHCLQTVIPLLPAMAFEGLLKKRRNGTAKPVPRMRRSTSASEVVRR